MRYCYSAYGLGIFANVPVPGLAPRSVSTDGPVSVSLGEAPPQDDFAFDLSEAPYYSSDSLEECGRPSLRVWKLADRPCYRFLYSDGIEFTLDGAERRIWATWPADCSADRAALYLLGPIFGFLLRRQGVVCLHASAVNVGGKAVVFLGPLRAGKSTTAAAFSALGFPVLSEDVLPLRECDGHFVAVPGYPRVRLWPESAEAVYGSRDALPRLLEGWEKRYLDLTRPGRFQQEPLPLGALYLLGPRQPDDDAPFIESVPAREAFIELVANTYANYLLDADLRRLEFQFLSRLARRMPLRRITPNDDPALLSRLCHAILSDLDASV